MGTKSEVIKAANLVFKYRLGSTAILQCYMNLRYNQASRLLEQLFDLGVVGPEIKSRPREVLIWSEEDLHNVLKNK